MTPQQRKEVARYLEAFDFSGLFTDPAIGWNWPDSGKPLRVPYNDGFIDLQHIAEKRGVRILFVPPLPDGGIMPSDDRKKLEKAVTPLAAEHLLIFGNKAKTRQIWLWTSRLPGKPMRHRELTWEKGRANENILQKLTNIAFTLDDEEGLDITGVVQRLRDSLDRDRLTRRFYDDFKRHKDQFQKFIKGISDSGILAHYTSLMLNRLMFCYFLQQKGFLNGEQDYLRKRLETVPSILGKNKFHSFYRTFLKRLFFDGLDSEARPPELVALIGRNIPYLNGGIFAEHPIERENPGITIPDDAFTKIFDFFDAWHWHLDDRPLGNDREINPEVLGYVFEKYTNQKEMGAYYTKEDITEYIGKNTILPFLLQKVAAKLPSEAWDLLKNDPDRYIYEAVRRGAGADEKAWRKSLPANIAAGIDTKAPGLIERRKDWNTPAPASHGLPTEIWRETIARHQRCHDLRRKLRAGQVKDPADLVTLNLEIRQFVQDIIANAPADLALALWKALRSLSTLDPTCGSGAFLFAALEILVPLYEGLLERFRIFITDWKASGEKHPLWEKDITKILEHVATHPNESYFIHKTIIVHNLYGVDIMEEAVEICKLRLFLKLAAQLEPGQAIEPLPDIDFNVRAGNTLVGYASKEEIKLATEGDQSIKDQDGRIQGMLGGITSDASLYENILEETMCADLAFKRFQDLQDNHGQTASDFRTAKADLENRLKALRNKLDRFLAGQYDQKNLKSDNTLNKWRKSHEPFHWFAEFYGIMNRGGFDVIIGNPPYVSSTKVRKAYTIRGLKTEKCTDIYAWVLERTESLLHSSGYCGMIVPLSLTFSSDFDSCRRLLFSSYGENWFSSFGRIPAALFAADVRVRNTIHIGRKSNKPGKAYSSRLHRWFERAREHLLPVLEYSAFRPEVWGHRIPKLNTNRVVAAFERAFEKKATLDALTSKKQTPRVLHFKNSAYNWLNFCRKTPPCFEGNRKVAHTMFGDLFFREKDSDLLAMLLANGKLMMIFWFAIGDDFHLTRGNFADFPADLTKLQPSQRSALLRIVPELEEAMEKAIQYKLNAGRRVGNYNLAKCRDVTDQSDRILADALGFDEAWEDIELYYIQTIRTDFNSEEIEE